jgi:ubiquinone/menaquinone biosynthesis C-methylase UbiE
MTIEKKYLETLKLLAKRFETLPKTRTMTIAKIDILVKLNMEWEAFQLDKSLEVHPFLLVDELIQKAIDSLNSWESISFCDGGITIKDKKKDMEDGHHDLFQALWIKFNESQYQDRIKLYDSRLSVNNLGGEYFKGKKIIDMGCGHGNFAHAFLNAGADSVLGIDYGEESIKYANAARDRLGISEDKLEFKLENVYSVDEEDSSFDFAVQNGVFHHLEDEDRAYSEMYRLLKPGGLAWVYTEGDGSIARDLFHESVKMLVDVPATLVQEHLGHLGFSINKRYHLGDGLKAVYRATTLDNFKNRLEKIGFSDFKRLRGCVPTDHDITEDDNWSKEKYGDGDIRLLIRKR